ncbi:16S rRNA (guanine(966)-N(2))-methyltransferase RsmD [Marinomonas sp. M1K-6]|uniref:Ribosomal RNA small subunit methyltransferase D n=1 Tax=Marinomonas profundi TaxID=2726122 RepID=A0A847R0Y2_9GAMM|nr:16S rRNA (guanine(966)-N(2))-methyltransferase RsmD [Marinomonas profundi]NLQ17265.1 16S rRNA (guanine(966)-N(2))-methyltransferase RsmD [Marinomonas profundi]UDV04546.1 16S rRNA (guanine(966)-N(2))-methyltransferase RsmD [Marinomonas profundi]
MKKNTPNSPLNKSKAKVSKLRIIAGEWRSRQLPIPNVEGLRPTPDKVRETLFNWINAHIPGAICGDLFCGSGALGLEALSRGAKHLTFVDNSRVVSQQMNANLATLNATDKANVIAQNAAVFLDTATPQALDIVFLDPPFRKGWLGQIIPLLEKGWLAQRALVYIEMEKEAELPALPSHWSLIKEKNAGQLVYRLFEINQ